MNINKLFIDKYYNEFNSYINKDFNLNKSLLRKLLNKKIINGYLKNEKLFVSKKFLYKLSKNPKLFINKIKKHIKNLNLIYYNKYKDQYEVELYDKSLFPDYCIKTYSEFNKSNIDIKEFKKSLDYLNIEYKNYPEEKFEYYINMLKYRFKFKFEKILENTNFINLGRILELLN